ncbi:MAG: hypothetical protein ACXW30_04615 [Micavibrio sp.]
MKKEHVLYGRLIPLENSLISKLSYPFSIFIVLTLFLPPALIYVPGLLYTIIWGTHYTGHIRLVKDDDHCFRSKLFKIKSPQIRNDYGRPLCVNEDTYKTTVAGGDYLKVSGKLSFFGKTITGYSLDFDFSPSTENQIENFWNSP